ncbi:MAG: hypothetical protein KJN64_08335 [Ignavibacteria bacterium]|nr:hypothetical protein [Ignavibacteria bacterium]MBT8381223.1 hypothetical protein [Ignavibacteria bacterium]MBT8392113.1 hypothetical protein [Ignavibacteria bacterium]NNJ53900.1 hypothetical protein [Ignavibacteriaceae bacterium]NNL22645.1 hypothetical protein [Ignavibacteriaceae bacterium]
MDEREFKVTQISKLKAESIKIFPDDFCDLSHSTDLTLPDENLVLGKDFFGSFEIATTSGEGVLNIENQSKAKFIVYSSKKRSKQIKIPNDSKLITDSVKRYENYLDHLLTKIKKDYQNENLDIKNLGIVSGEILKRLNLTRL